MPDLTMMGVTTAIPAREFDSRTRDEAVAMVKDLAEQMQPALRRFVGDAQMKGSPAVKLDGPDDSPLLGKVYALTLAGPFNPDDLPADCEAYMAYNGGAGGVVQPDRDATDLVVDDTPERT